MSQEDGGKPLGAAPEPQTPTDTAAKTAAETTPITAEELAALPPVSELTAASDLRPFLRIGVPAALKNAAMRRMWLLNPVIRDHADCAVDYAWDWNTPGGVPGSGGRLSAESTRRLMQAFSPAKEPAGPPPEATAAAEPDALPEDPEAATAPAPESAKEPPAQRKISRDDSAATPARPRHGGARPR